MNQAKKFPIVPLVIIGVVFVVGIVIFWNPISTRDSNKNLSLNSTEMVGDSLNKDTFLVVNSENAVTSPNELNISQNIVVESNQSINSQSVNTTNRSATEIFNTTQESNVPLTAHKPQYSSDVLFQDSFESVINWTSWYNGNLEKNNDLAIDGMTSLNIKGIGGGAIKEMVLDSMNISASCYIYDSLDSNSGELFVLSPEQIPMVNNGLGVGVMSKESKDKFVIYSGDTRAYSITNVPRTRGWQKLEISTDGKYNYIFINDAFVIKTKTASNWNHLFLQIDTANSGIFDRVSVIRYNSSEYLKDKINVQNETT